MTIFGAIIFWVSLSFGAAFAWWLVCITRDWLHDLAQDETLRRIDREWRE